MKNHFKKYVIFSLISIFLFSCIGCKQQKTYNDKELKDVIDNVLSYKNGYDDYLCDYISYSEYIDSNYPFFYSLLLDGAELTSYDSEVISIEDNDGEYKVCLILNMIAQGASVEEDGVVHRDIAQGKDVPVEVTLIEKNDHLYVEEVKEYETLNEAKKENENFQ